MAGPKISRLNHHILVFSDGEVTLHFDIEPLSDSEVVIYTAEPEVVVGAPRDSYKNEAQLAIAWLKEHFIHVEIDYDPPPDIDVSSFDDK